LEQLGRKALARTPAKMAADEIQNFQVLNDGSKSAASPLFSWRVKCAASSHGCRDTHHARDFPGVPARLSASIKPPMPAGR